MAYHVRRQIREAVATAVTGLTTTSTRVFQSRAYPLATTDLPCLLISTPSEQSAVVDFSVPLTVERRLSVRIDAVVRGTSDVDDTLDLICKEVEIALATPCSALSGLANSIALTATDLEFDASGEQPVGRATMQFDVIYFTKENAPDMAH